MTQKELLVVPPRYNVWGLRLEPVLEDGLPKTPLKSLREGRNGLHFTVNACK